NLDSARKEYEKAVAGDLRDLGSRLALADISLKQKRPADALRFADEIIARDPESGQGKLMRVRALMATGNMEAARKENKLLEQKYPTSRDISAVSGTIAIIDKNFAEAEKIFKKLAQLDPKDSRASEGLAEMYI